MLARTSFKQKRHTPIVKEPRVTKWPVALAVRASAAINTIAGEVVSQPKTKAIRSEPYRRLVAAMPCKACGIQGYSQAAHLPPDGKSTKQDDRLIFALCCDRPGKEGCHPQFDQYRMFKREVAMTVGMAWAMDTMRAVASAGQWPKSLPVWEREESPKAVDISAQSAINSGVKP